MKRKSLFVPLFFLLILLIISVSCNSEPTYTAEEWEDIQEEENKGEELAEIQKKIDDYYKRLNEWDKYATTSSTVLLPHDDKISELLEKIHQATENNEWDKCEVYDELIADEYDEMISDLSKINVPEFAKEEFNLYLDFLFNSKEYFKYMSFGEKNFDAAKAENLNNERSAAIIKATKEIERIKQTFNKEAEELGLSIPFPNVD